MMNGKIVGFAIRLFYHHPSIFIGIIAGVLSVAGFAYFSPCSLVNNYVNTIQHVNIARKVVDSISPDWWERYVQLGSPWLPLPHVLMAPFAANDFLWRSAIAGSIVSMLSYVILLGYIQLNSFISEFTIL